MGFEPFLELALAGLLAVTLVHAIRLQRALARMRLDRASLDDAVAGFDGGVRQAEAGLASLREAARQMAAQLSEAEGLRNDLGYLTERGNQAADRLDTLVRAARTPEPAPAQPVRSQAERNLLAALQAVR